MSHQNSDPTNDSNLRQRALSRWENEGVPCLADLKPRRTQESIFQFQK